MIGFLRENITFLVSSLLLAGLIVVTSQLQTDQTQINAYQAPASAANVAQQPTTPIPVVAAQPSPPPAITPTTTSVSKPASIPAIPRLTRHRFENEGNDN